ncbi:restriction endonuclease subunit S [Gallibacterium anatis]|uniref:restriction endonuclease subunit S n=1 Tax=Gallibacterium anatis TaxID=750 RepID=UPI0039FC7717
MKNHNIPKLRYPEFTDAWEKCKLGDFVEITTGKLDANAMVNDGKYDFYTSGIKKFKINIPAFTGPAITIAGNGATVGFMHLADGEFNAYQRTYVLTKFSNSIREFLFYEIGIKLPRKISAEARTGNIPYIVMDMLTNLDVFTPTVSEQQKIGNLFKQLDHLITLHKRKWDDVILLKKALLQKMFPKNGSDFPEIRFPEFTDAWEKWELGKIVNIVGGGTPDTNNATYWNGNIDWYSPTEIGNEIYVSNSLKKISKLGLEKSSAKLLPAHKTILFTSRASIGDMAILLKSSTTNQGFQSFVIDEEQVDIYFLYSLGFKIKHFALKNATGSTFLEISKKQLEKMEISIPTLPEQQKIGNLFKQLDRLITLHKRQHEHYQLLKKALLQQIFV